MRTAENPATLQDVLELVEGLKLDNARSPAVSIERYEWLNRDDGDLQIKITHRAFAICLSRDDDVFDSKRTKTELSEAASGHPTGESALTALYNQIEKKYGGSDDKR